MVTGRAAGSTTGRPRVFLSYRRQDTAFQADLLYGQLVDAFGRDRVFKDVDSIEPGDDFTEAIERAVTSCTVLLVLIGDRWLASTDGAGRRRLDDPADFVRLEIEFALRAGVRVVPVLLETELPAAEQLPAPLAPLVTRQAVVLAAHGFVEGARRLVGRLAELAVQAAVDEPPAYLMQVADIAPDRLDGRDAELAELAAFGLGTGPYPDQYCWWQADAWAGKTALTAWFALHPPPGLDVAAFFVAGGLAGQSDGDAFLEAMAEQLTALAGLPSGVPATATVRRGRLLALLAAAAEHGRAAGRRLLLLVDGLDEDTGPAAGSASIASLLPRRPPPDLRILVTSRVDPDLPRDVPIDHPLHGCRLRRIAPSVAARDLAQLATRELTGQLAAGALHADLLGLVTASGGGLSADDLAALTGRPLDAVCALLLGDLGRCVRGRRQRLAGSRGAGRGYLFAHDTLRALAEQEFGTRLAGYRERLHGWAAGFRDRGWPSVTPLYLLRDYPRLLWRIGDLGRLVALAGDRERHELMLALTGGDAQALDEVALATAAASARSPAALGVLVELALRRAELSRRNTILPVGLAAVWAALGDTARAEAVAAAVAGAGRRADALADAALAAASIGRWADVETLLDRIDDGERRDRATVAVLAGQAAAAPAGATPDRTDRLAARIRADARRAAALRPVRAARAAARPGGVAGVLAELGERPAARALTELAVALAAAGQSGAARAIVAAGAGRRGPPPATLARLGVALAGAGAFDDAERLLAGIRPIRIRAGAVAELVAAAAAGGAPDVAARGLGELAALLPRLRDPRVAVDLLLPIGPALVGAGLGVAAGQLAELAGRLLDEVPGQPEWARARRLVGCATGGDWGHLPADLRHLDDPDTRARTVRALGLLATVAGDDRRTAPLVASIADPRRRAEVLTALARAAVAAGRRERAAALATAAARTARTGADAERVAAAADQVVDGLLVRGELDRAAALAERITEPDMRESALGRVAVAEATAGRVGAARVVLAGLAPIRRVWGLAGVAEVCAAAGDATAARGTVDELDGLLTAATGIDVFSRVAVGLRLAGVFGVLGDPERALHRLRAADRDTAGITDPQRLARALTVLAVLARRLGRDGWAVELHRRVGGALAAVAAEPARSRAHARLAEALAEVGEPAAAAHRLGQVDRPAPRIRAACAVAVADPGRARALLLDAAARVGAVEPAADRAVALGRLATAAAALTAVPTARIDVAWATRPVAELLAGEAWSWAAPALARLDPPAFARLASWVHEQLDPAGE